MAIFGEDNRANWLLRDYAALWDVRVFIPLTELAPTIIRGATCDEKMLRITLWEFHSWPYAEEQLTLQIDRLRDQKIAVREAKILKLTNELKELDPEVKIVRNGTA